LCGEHDVIGNHAASAGQIDDDKLFYLMSRGFSHEESKRIIVESAFRPIIDQMPDEKIQERILERVGAMMKKVESN
jgi:Fe-S cluster assembly scaffold protein SufB